MDGNIIPIEAACIRFGWLLFRSFLSGLQVGLIFCVIYLFIFIKVRDKKLWISFEMPKKKKKLQKESSEHVQFDITSITHA